MAAGVGWCLPGLPSLLSISIRRSPTCMEGPQLGDPGSHELRKLRCSQQSFCGCYTHFPHSYSSENHRRWLEGLCGGSGGSPPGQAQQGRGKLFMGKPRLAVISCRWRKSNQQSVMQRAVTRKDKKPPLLSESPPGSARVSSEHPRATELSPQHICAPKPP